MDATSRARSDTGILGTPPRLPLLASRPGYEILQLVPIYGETKWGEAHHAPCEQSKSERVCRAMGSFGASGMPVQACPLQRAIADACTNRVHGSLSHRAKSPGEAQSDSVPGKVRHAWQNRMSRSSGRLAQVLLSRRMNILTIRVRVRTNNDASEY